MLKQRGVDSWFISKTGGWTQNSRVLQDYIKTSQQDTREALLKARGIEVKREGMMQPMKCPRCKEVNPPSSQFCVCGQPLTPQAIEKSKMLLAEQVSKLLIQNAQMQHSGFVEKGQYVPNQSIPLDPYQLAGYRAEVNVVPGSGASVFGTHGQQSRFVAAPNWIKCPNCDHHYQNGTQHHCTANRGGL